LNATSISDPSTERRQTWPTGADSHRPPGDGCDKDLNAAFDEIMTTAVKRQHEPQRVIGDLLTAEINEKQARPIKYQLTITRARAVSATLTSSDGASATARTRRSRGQIWTPIDSRACMGVCRAS